MSEDISSAGSSGPSKPPEAVPSPDTGYTFTDDPWIRWRNTYRYFTGGLTEEGVKQYREGRDARMEASDCRKCEQNRDYLLQYSTATVDWSGDGSQFAETS